MNFEEQVNLALGLATGPGDPMLNTVMTQEGHKLYVVGRNEQSAEAAKKYKVLGLIDDFSLDGDLWNGIPVIRSSEVDQTSFIINCSTAISPVLLRNNLYSAGLSNVIPISELIRDHINLLSPPLFVIEQREELRQNAAWWSELYSLLSDEISRKTLGDVLRFRLTADLDYMNDYHVRLRDQYFEEFMEYSEEIFVDAGGFDGDTTEEFINRYPDYQKVYLFEPSTRNLDAAKIRLKGRRDIDFRPVGLSDSEGLLQFDSNSGSASAVTSGPGESIRVVTLDAELENEYISFIKMDLEGWEMNALRGAKRIIKKHKPKLAIAVYHSAKDFREVPSYILNIRPDYKVFLRHYTQGWSETVMFFV
jgi:FkbM family methyltransferase